MAISARIVAVKILTGSIKNKLSLASVLERKLLKLPLQEHGFCKELCFGVMREFYVLDKTLRSYLKRPIKRKELELKLILLVGLYQLYYLRVPDHAAIKETVDLCGAFNKIWAKSLVNAILRKAKSKDRKDFVIAQTHPEWLVARIKTAWPEDWQGILKANQQKPPMHLRVNLAKNSVAQYLEILKAANIEAVFIKDSKTGVEIKSAQAVESLPGFNQGGISVQDAAAQLVPDLLELEPGQKVLDACAAPGGKTTHILESTSDLRLSALDNNAARLEKVKSNLQRLKFTAELICGDAKDDSWWDGAQFDRILLDVPCSATGVIRRNPDVKVLLEQSQLPELIKTQAEILENTWRMLKPGGILLYVSCSLMPEENQKQIGKFLPEHEDAKEVEISANGLRQLEHGAQALSIDKGWDNFYYAKLKKAELGIIIYALCYN